VDMSGSKKFGSQHKSKSEIATEIATILGFSAINNRDKVGLLLFSNQIELFIPPKKGKAHMMRLIREIYHFSPKHKGTNLSQATDFIVKMIKRKSIMFLISDFIDSDVEDALSLVSKKHDVVPVVLHDPVERSLKKTGIIFLEDNETGECLYINSNLIHHTYQNMALTQSIELKRIFRSYKLDFIDINTAESYIDPLSLYFSKRAMR